MLIPYDFLWYKLKRDVIENDIDITEDEYTIYVCFVVVEFIRGWGE